MIRRLFPLSASLLLLAALPVQAGVFDGDALKAVTTLRTEHTARLDKLEESAHNQLEVANQLEALKAEVARQRGLVEVLTFDLAQAQKRIQDYYVDLDTRQRKLEAALKAAEAAPKQPAAADPALETPTFEAALNLFKGGKFKDASDAFRAFIAAYPASPFAPSAHYWGANAHFQLREWFRAADLYAVISQKWPADPKAPDSLLQLADSKKEAGDPRAAQETLEELVMRYPDSPAAASAKQRLVPPSRKKGH